MPIRELGADKVRANEIKHRLLKEQGLTLKAFTEMHGFSYRAVSDLVRGVRKGYYGEGRDIAEKLGLL